jgi:hypothetical protein
MEILTVFPFFIYIFVKINIIVIMENKYINLKNFENNVVKPLILRIMKESHSISEFDIFTKFRDSIDKIQLPIEVIEDILSIICDTGLLEKDFLIQEIYYSNFKFRGVSRDSVFSRDSVLKKIYEFSPYKLLTSPVDWLIFWSNSKKGSPFYNTLCQKVNKILNTKKILRMAINYV